MVINLTRLSSALPLCPLLGGKLKLRCRALKVTHDSRILLARMNIAQPHTFGHWGPKS